MGSVSLACWAAMGGGDLRTAKEGGEGQHQTAAWDVRGARWWSQQSQFRNHWTSEEIPIQSTWNSVVETTSPQEMCYLEFIWPQNSPFLIVFLLPPIYFLLGFSEHAKGGQELCSVGCGCLVLWSFKAKTSGPSNQEKYLTLFGEHQTSSDPVIGGCWVLDSTKQKM